MNRRDFLKGVGAVAVPAAMLPPGFSPLHALTRQLTAADAVPISAVVYDERYPDCRTFADALIHCGAVPFPIAGDSARLWYGPLGAHLSRHPGRVAGLGTYADFTVCAFCGREQNLTLLFQGAHDARNAPPLLHRLRAPDADRQIAAALYRSQTSWPESLANALLRIPTRGESASLLDFTAISSAAPSLSSGHPGYLASWLLAPANG